MSDQQTDAPEGAATPPAADDTDVQRIPLFIEELTVSRRTVETATVRVATVTRTREVLVDEPMTRQRVEVERVPVGRFVESMPPVREEGDVTIVPVIEEVVVIERRLLLKEEVRIRRVQHEERHVETVQIRDQEAVITRTPASTADQPVAEATQTPIRSEQQQ